MNVIGHIASKALFKPMAGGNPKFCVAKCYSHKNAKTNQYLSSRRVNLLFVVSSNQSRAEERKPFVKELRSRRLHRRCVWNSGLTSMSLERLFDSLEARDLSGFVSAVSLGAGEVAAVEAVADHSPFGRVVNGAAGLVHSELLVCSSLVDLL